VEKNRLFQNNITEECTTKWNDYKENVTIYQIQFSNSNHKYTRSFTPVNAHITIRTLDILLRLMHTFDFNQNTTPSYTRVYINGKTREKDIFMYTLMIMNQTIASVGIKDE